MDLFSQSLIVPENLRFYLHRLADNAQPSTNILRVNALNSATAGSGGLIIVRLPMALVDLNSFAMHFETNMTPGAITPAVDPEGNGDGTLNGILPKGIESLISRLEVSVNGLGLLNLQQYNLLFNMLKDSHLHLDKSLNRTQLQNEKDVVPLLASSSGSVPDITSTSEIIPLHVTNWSAVASDTTAINFTCTTTTSQPMPCTGQGAYELKYFPTLKFFGITGVTTITGDAQIYEINTKSVAYLTSGVGGATPTPATYVTEFKVSVPITSTTPVVPTGPTATYTNQQFTCYVTPVQPVNPVTSAQPLPRVFPNNNQFHSIHDWLGFFKAAPSWIQTQMLGEVEIRITLAQNDVLGISHPYIPYNDPIRKEGWRVGSLPDYSLQNIFFSIRTCSFDNNFVDDMLHHKLSSGGEIEIPYSNYFNINQVQSSGATQTRFSVNTQSLDKVVSCNRVAGFNQYYNNLCNVPCGMGPTSRDTMGVVHKTPYFSTTASNPSGYNYGTATAEGTGAFNYYQYQINNSFIPNYKISPVNTFFFNQEMYGMHNDWASGTIATTPTIYLNSNYQMGVCLDFMDEAIPRLVSGVDTRGAVSVAYLNQDANNQGDRTDVFTCFTSILRVGSNQQVQVVY